MAVEVARLNNDLLWKIFMFVTEGTDYDEDKVHDPRIDTVRHGSQVCRHWRAIILQSTSIWGRLMNLDLLQDPTNNWSQTIISRTGDALLWVRGYTGRRASIRWYHSRFSRRTDFKSHELPGAVYMPFMRQNWSRIQRFNVLHCFGLDIPFLPESEIGTIQQEEMEFWASLFQLPAPNLEKFEFEFNDNFVSGKLFLPSPLFHNFSPFLNEVSIYRRTLHFSPTTKLTMSLPRSWFGQLRIFTLSQQSFSSELLQMLGIMHNLEMLYLQGHVIKSANENIPVIHLPRLKTLELSNNGSFDKLSVLEAIIPSAGCSLIAEFSSSPSDIHGDLQNVIRVQMAMVRYLRTYISLRQPKSFVLHYGPTGVKLTDSPIKSHFLVSYKFTTTQDFDLYPDADVLLKELASSEAPYISVQDLELMISPKTPPCSLDVFAFVTTISLDAHTFKYLWNQQEYLASILFPCLIILRLNSKSNQLPSIEILCQFLEHRVNNNHPLSVLDLTLREVMKETGRYQYNLGLLEEMRGLMVRWKERPKGVKPDAELLYYFSTTPHEYVCGSGQPPILRYDDPGTTFYNPGRNLSHSYGWSAAF